MLSTITETAKALRVSTVRWTRCLPTEPSRPFGSGGDDRSTSPVIDSLECRAEVERALRGR